MSHYRICNVLIKTDVAAVIFIIHLIPAITQSEVIFATMFRIYHGHRIINALPKIIIQIFDIRFNINLGPNSYDYGTTVTTLSGANS